MKNAVGTKQTLQEKMRKLTHRARKFGTEKLNLWANRPRVLANSVPKSGTNLLRRCLELMPGMMDADIYLNRPTGVADLRAKFSRVYRGSFIRGHVPFTPEYLQLTRDFSLRTILMVRDPRDVVVSLMHWVTSKNKTHRLHPYFSKLGTDEQRLLEVIEGVAPERMGWDPGTRGLENVRDYVAAFLPWLEHGSFLIRFEDLIGAEGGGSREKQLSQVSKLAQHLDLDLDEQQVASVAGRIFNPQGHTFRKGQIGDWRNHFTAAHRDAFKQVAGELLIQMGYETDLSW